MSRSRGTFIIGAVQIKQYCKSCAGLCPDPRFIALVFQRCGASDIVFFFIQRFLATKMVFLLRDGVHNSPSERAYFAEAACLFDRDDVLFTP